MRRTLWALLLVCACSAPQPEPASPPAEPTPEAPEAPEAPSSVPAPAPIAPPSAPGSPVALGSMMLLAERCTLSGAPLEATDAFDAIRAVAWTDDAHVFVIDAEGLLRR